MILWSFGANKPDAIQAKVKLLPAASHVFAGRFIDKI